MALTKQIILILCLNFYVVSIDGELCVGPETVFAEKSIEFEICAMQHAISNDFCSNCMVAYVEQFQSYNQLLKTQITSKGNKTESCGDLLNEEDRLNIFCTQYDRIRDQWHGARCSSTDIIKT